MFNNFRIAISKTFKEWMDSFNSLLDKLDELPLPIAYGTNSQMQYLKLSNGTVLMWGRIDYGTRYPFNTAWEGLGGAGYASEEFTLNFPIPLVDQTSTVIPHVINSTRSETFVLTTGVSYTSYKGRFWSAASDTGGASVLNIIVIGPWK